MTKERELSLSFTQKRFNDVSYNPHVQQFDSFRMYIRTEMMLIRDKKDFAHTHRSISSYFAF